MGNYLTKLPDDAKQVKNALTWLTPDGKVFGKETRMLKNRFNGNLSPHKHYGEFFQYTPFVNKHNGYVYCPIKYILPNGKYQVRQRRLHIVIAETFIENPLNLPIVGHKNNIKSDIKVSNLYWMTPSENTQKAVDDGLLVNDKGYDDSQSFPVIMFDTYTNQEIKRYGSIKEASRDNPNISPNTISRQCKYKKPVRKPYYFRYQSDKSIEEPIIVIQYDYYTDKEIGRYYNTWDASRKTGINSKTIQQQCNNNFKPKHKTKDGTYFQFSK